MSLIDPRVTRQAEILVNHSIKVKKGDSVIVVADYLAKPLVLEVYKLLIKAGASLVRVSWDSYELSEIFYENASPEQLKKFPKISFQEIKQMDCYIGIWSSVNTRGLSGIDPVLISQRSEVLRPILDWRVEKTRWVATIFPCEALAQEADMSLSSYEDFVFSAINNVDWKKKFIEQEKLRKLVDKTKMVHIFTPNTDLTFDISGRKAVNANGEYNMPDGEVFTSVLENSANGHIKYTYPAIFMGREFHEVRLEFKAGKVIKAEASKGEKDLNKILDMDKGAKIIGEFGIGNNFKIDRFTKNILFDEKIGGSIHIALGRGFKETLSRTKSALHWDMICDLRGAGPASPDERASRGGELWFDKKLVQKNGCWLIL
jgi:aminopeptidase